MHVLALEQEGAEDAACFVLTEFRRTALQFIENAEIGVEGICPMLGKVTDLGIGAELSLPFLEGNLACQDFDQRGLTGTVGPDKCNAVAASYTK